ncbi:MAG: hypothetical protein P1U74_08805 [Legionellaceae bacterium]|nr:hypothetical protein [Legionellaceae bacterium]
MIKSDGYTGLEGENGDAEKEMMSFYTQRMDELYKIHADQQGRELQDDEKRVIILSSEPSTTQENVITNFSEQSPDTYKPSAKKAHSAFKKVPRQKKQHQKPSEDINHQDQKPQEHYSIQQLTTRWEELQVETTRSKVLLVELARLSHEISVLIYQNRHLSTTVRKQHLGLGLAVEECRIQQMQTSPKENMRSLAKSMQKSAKYFKTLYFLNLHSNESKELKDEIKKSYQLMDARANDFEPMLASYYVDDSKKTTKKEGSNERCLQYNLESNDDLSQLCQRYKNLMGGYNYSFVDIDSFDELSTEDKYTFLSLQVLNVVDFTLLQKSRTYLTDVYCQFFSEMPHENSGNEQVDIITYENLQDLDTVPMESLHLDALLHSNLGEKLQQAIRIYNTIKCKYLEQLCSKYPADSYISGEYFSADFRLKAYNFLFNACVDESEPADIDLMKRNCWDIINEGDYRSPTLVVLAKYKIDCMANLDTNPEEISSIANDTPQVQETTKIEAVSNQADTLVESKSHIPVEKSDEETIWSQLCSAHVLTYVCFEDYIEKIYRERYISETVADFLYQAITNHDKPLLVDENNLESFIKLYEIIVRSYYVPKEFSSLEKTLGDNVLRGREYDPISSDKMMVKAINIYDELLKLIRVYKPEIQLKIILLKVELFYEMRRIVPKREFLSRCEESLQEAQECIHLAPSQEEKMKIITLLKNVKKIVKNAPLEKERQTFIAVDNYMYSTYLSEKEQLMTRAMILEKAPLNITSRINTLIKLFKQHTILLQLRSYLHIIFKSNLSVWQQVLPLSYTVQAQLEFLGNLQFLHMSAINEYYDRNLPNKKSIMPAQLPSIISWMRMHYTIDLAYHAKILEMSHEEYFASQLRIIEEQQTWIAEALNEMDARFAFYRREIQELSDEKQDFPDFHQISRQQLSFLNLDIREELQQTTNLSSECLRSLEYITYKQYWQASYSVANEKTPAACYIKASIMHWVFNLFSTPSFTSSLSGSEVVLISLEFTLATLKEEIINLVEMAKKEKVLNKPARDLLTFEPTNLIAASIFAPREDELQRDAHENCAEEHEDLVRKVNT